MTYLYLFCAFFVAIWIPGMYTFLSQREIPAMAIREWPLKLLSNIFGLIYVIFMCFTLESYFDDVASFLPHCTTFLWFQFLYVPFLSMVKFLSLSFFHISFISLLIFLYLSFLFPRNSLIFLYIFL